MLLEAKNLFFNYRKTEIIKNFSLQLSTGDFTMILGPNGSGKSTILKLLSSYLKADLGEILLDGKSINEYSHRERAKLIAVVSQNSCQASDFTAFEMVLMGRHSYLSRLLSPSNEDLSIIEKTMKSLDIWHLANRRCTQLSGGERQRVAIASALASCAKFILLDEPTSALDISHTLKLMQLLRDYSKDAGILIISHDLQIAMQYAKKLILLNNGQSYIQGEVNQVITEKNIKAVYNCQSKIHIQGEESYIILKNE